MLNKTAKSFIFFGVLIVQSVFAQTPANDPAWRLIWNDEFQESNINPMRWCRKDWRRFAHGRHDLNAFRTTGNDNLSFDTTGSGVVTQIVRREQGVRHNHLNVSSGMIEDWNYEITAPASFMSMTKFRYGYFEIRFRLSQLSGLQNHSGIGANFWMYWHDEDYTTDDASEIDIFESLHACGQNHLLSNNQHLKLTSWPKTLHENTYASCPNCSCFPLKGRNIDFSTFHKIGIAWTPTRIDYFLDDVPYYSSNFFPDKKIAQRIVVDINVFTAGESPDANTLFPYEYEIDYVRVYNLDQSRCNVAYNQCSFQAALPSLYKTIAIGGGCNATVPTGNNVNLRASQSITLDDQFTIENGANFSMDIVPCHQSVVHACTNLDCAECK